MSKIAPEGGTIDDKYAKVDLLGGGSPKRTRSPPKEKGKLSPTRKLMDQMGKSFKRKTSEQRHLEKQERLMERIVSSREASPQLVSAVLRRQSRARSVSEDLSTTHRHDYFEDDEVIYDYDQIALQKLIQRHLNAGGCVQRWRKIHPLAVLLHEGDPKKIPPPLFKLIKTGHTLDGSGMFTELMDILKRSKCIILSFGKDWKIDFYPITVDDAFEIYGKIPCDISFEDVCKERGETYTERIMSVPGIDSLVSDGLIYGARRRAVLETFTLEEIGVQKDHHLVLEASWGGPQFCLKNEDAYVVVNRTKGPYILPKINESHPVGYRRFFDYTQREQQALLDKAKSSTKLAAKRWRRSDLACLLLYNSNLDLVPDSILTAALASVSSVGEYGLETSSIKANGKSFGLESFDAILLDFYSDDRPNFTFISARRLAINFKNYFAQMLTFDDVVKSKGTHYRDCLFKFEGVKEIANRGLLIGAEARSSISTFSGSELGMRHDTFDLVLETHYGAPHFVRKGENFFIQCDDYDEDAIILAAETIGKTFRPVGLEAEEDFIRRSNDNSGGVKVDESTLENRIAEKIEKECLNYDCLRSLTMPSAEHDLAHRFVSVVCILFGVANVAMQVYLAIKYAGEAGEDALPAHTVALTASWIFLPTFVKCFFSCFASRCLLASDKLALLPLGINVKYAFEIFAGPRSVGHDDRMTALATARIIDVFGRCLPQTMTQTYVLAYEDAVIDPWIVSVVVAIACLTAGSKLAAVNMDFDCDPRNRRSDGTTFGYYPAGTGRQITMFGLETVFGSSFVALRSLTIACVWATFGWIPIASALVFDFVFSVVVRYECGYLPYYSRAQPVLCNLASVIVVFASGEFAPLTILRSPYLVGGAGTMFTIAYVLAQSMVAGAFLFFMGNESVRVLVIIIAIVLFALGVSQILITLAADTSFDVVEAWVRHRTPRSHFEDHVWNTFSPNLFGPTIEDHRGWILEFWHPRNWQYQFVSEWIGDWMQVWTARENVIPPWASEAWMSLIPPDVREEGNFIMKVRAREKETLQTQETLRSLRLGYEQNSGDKMLSVLRFAQKWKKKALGPKIPPGMLLAMSTKIPQYDPLAALKATMKAIEESSSEDAKFVMEEVSDTESIDSDIGIKIAGEKIGEGGEISGESDDEENSSDGSVEL